MVVTDLKNKNIKDLKEELTKLEKDLQKVVSDILQKKEKNVKKASFLRKDIARIKTVLNEKLKEEKNEH
ncbi:MAG TPA: 50S ribosomal protein L29 [bacterium]|jgi:ribosomal protein L29|nr:50S ribosomal protein L29 [bacterium]HQG58292.1 50S ribosomal protein L29 [bacterium]HQG78738.1 50S ribosomal protein L29 [bacterium]HQK41398.1 50S ribosomal protein L29 [bacterium]